jgi:hypothetical protein
MNYNHFGYFVIGFCLLLLLNFEAYPHLLVVFLLSGFYLIVVESGKFPRLGKFINDAF